MNRQGPVLFEAPLAHEVLHASHCNCRECRNNFAQAFAPGWAEREWEAAVGQNPPLPQKQPLAVPPGNPVPFAAPPPVGSYWPIKTTSKEGRLVSYTASDGSPIETNKGRKFLDDRKGKRGPRWHVGVDLYANIGDVIVACEDGIIRGFFDGFTEYKHKPPTSSLLIEHSTAVVNYGEVDPKSRQIYHLYKGMKVLAGQPIAIVGSTNMLHFETYIKGTTRSHQWWKDEARPPQQLLNPTKYLLFLQQYGLPQQASGSRPAPPSTKLPDINGFGPKIEGYASYVGQSTCDTRAKPGVVAFRNLMLKVFPGTGSSGIVRDCKIGGRSEHKEGRAWDWTVSAKKPSDVAKVDQTLAWLFATDKYGHQHAMIRRLGIMYIIWNRRIWSASRVSEGWRPYSGHDAHTGHVHFSFSWDGANRATTFWNPEKSR